MGQTAQRCCGIGDAIAEVNTDTANEEKSHLLTEFRSKKKSGTIINKSICNKLEQLIQSDPLNRCIGNLHIPGELYKATIALSSAKHIIIMTGFPCCVKEPFTGNDGPAGTMLLAYSLLKHNYNHKVTIMIDPIHKSTMRPLIKYFNDNSRLKNKNPLKLYVLQKKIDFDNDFIENDTFIDVDCIVSIKLAGTTKDGTHRTASGRDISDKCGECALLYDYINKNHSIEITTIAVGDSGNECGMGKVRNKITEYVTNGKTIACNINADYLITAGISNWGAEALSVALGSFPDDRFHDLMYTACNEYGMADSVNGELNGTVNGLPYLQHSKMYENLCAVYKKKQGNHINVDYKDDDDTDSDEDKEEYLPLPGKCMIKRTFDLKKDLLTLKKKYHCEYKELLEREWKIIDKDKYDKGGDDIVKIMQFNMLADGLSCAYSNIETEKSFIGVDKECLQWTYRGLRICEEITRFDPDIVCIQECDQILFLMQYLARFGYDFYAQNSGDTVQKVAKQLSQERGTEIKMPDCNVVILVKSKRFEVIDDDDKFIQKIDKTKNEANVAALVVPLRFKQNNKEFIMVTTHLKSKKTLDGEKIRKKQINLLLKELISNDDNLPLILCCDLNGNPIQNKNGYDPLCYDSIVSKDNGIGYKSVYRLISDDNKEPEYTTWKYRKHGTDKHTIDYIFVNDEDRFNIVAVLDIPNVKGDKLDNVKALIPNWNYPSDHFSLLTQLTFK